MATGSRDRNRAAQAERAAATRLRILDAATDLFVARGFLQTTMADIAAAAEVAVQTLYTGYGSKLALLQAAHDRAVDGPDGPVPVLERPWRRRLRDEPDGRRALAVFTDEASRIVTRVNPLYTAMVAASGDADVATVLAANRQRRYDTFAAVVRDLATKPGFRASSRARCAQSFYALLSHETYSTLVVSHGWRREAWRDWATDTAAAEMFG